MSIECKKCQDTVCIYAGTDNVCYACDLYNPPQPPQPITNCDKIRAMSDEELAKTVSQTGCGLCTALGIRELCRINKDMACEEIVLMWLNSAVEGEQK